MFECHVCKKDLTCCDIFRKCDISYCSYMCIENNNSKNNTNTFFCEIILLISKCFKHKKM